MATLRKIVPSGLADGIRPAYHFVLAVLGETIYGFPGRKLTVIGVTGTNGKSTTCNLITSVLEAGGHKVGMATTVNFQVGDKKWSNTTKMTSQGRFATYKLLRQMVKAGCTHAVIEVSSHALYWHRVWGVPFHTAVFTNLSRDHLDLHKTMENYRNTKGKLFAALKKGTDSVAVVNGEDPEAEYFLTCYADHKFVYGINQHVTEIMPLATTVVASDLVSDAGGSKFKVALEDGVVEARIHLPGRFNVLNALAAISVGVAHGVRSKQIAEGLDRVAGVSGRMEKVNADQPFPVIVDYAHTPDAFDKVLGTLRSVTKGKLIAVFGATGDRDRGKRPELGKIAAQHADYMILTEEDPGSEDPAKIIEEILPGIPGSKRESYEILVDRRQAIKRAFEIAKEGDAVVLLAKGHETVMTYADGKHPWSDQQVAAEEWHRLQRRKKA